MSNQKIGSDSQKIGYSFLSYFGGITDILAQKEEKVEKIEIKILRLSETTIRLGNCKKQRDQFWYRSVEHGKTKFKKRVIKQKEVLPIRFEEIEFKKGFKYTVKFQCSLCGKTIYKYFNGSVKRDRKNPICEHYQPIILGYSRNLTQKMFIVKLTVKRCLN